MERIPLGSPVPAVSLSSASGSIRRLIGFLAGRRKILIWLAVVTLLSIALDLTLPLLIEGCVDALGLFGLVLYVDGAPKAMCIASELNDCVCDVSFEKAVEINEAYAVINNEFAKHFTKYQLINREEDLGLEGLRKAKLSYHPDILYSKSVAYFK